MSKGLFAGRYSIERVLGQGATATVHLARDTQRGMAVAIKLLRPELAQSKATERFLKEIRRTSHLQHPHILQVLDSGGNDGRPYFVLPYMEGGTLRAKLKGGTQMSFDETIAILRTIAGALDYAHTKGLIHRDVKPENILFTNGEACLGDFGIARAVETVYGTDGSTSSDTIRGTYAYMSPEQAAGSPNLDGRSDIYSLACVAYEMITGMQAFIGPTPESVVAQRFQYSPREIRVYRPSAPPAVDAALAKAFAMSPADRYKTATEFLDALDTAVRASTGERTGNGHGTSRRYLGRQRILLIGGIAMVAALLAADTPLRDFLVGSAGKGNSTRTGELDTLRFAVLPAESNDSSVLEIDVAELLRESLRRWRGVAVVDAFHVRGALASNSTKFPTSEEASRAARLLGAGRYARVHISRFRDSLLIRASLFDTRSQALLVESGVSARADLSLADSAIALLADSLLFPVQTARTLRESTSGTRSAPARHSYIHAHEALAAWNLPLADSGFRRATEHDPNYSQAYVWLAQVRSWAKEPPSRWRFAAERAVAGSGRLSARDSMVSAALLLVATEDRPRACAAWQRLTALEPHDFTAWYALGTCLSSDSAVVRDSRTTSGWRFRSSYHSALEAYERAFRLLPSIHQSFGGSFEDLQRLFVTRANQSRTGRALSPDTTRFGALPSWQGDTLAFVPLKLAEFRASTRPATTNEALIRQRRRLYDVATSWRSTFPQSVGALHAVAAALDLLGDPSALDTLHLARQLASDPGDVLRIGVLEVWMNVKIGLPADLRRVANARNLADSLLRNHQPASAIEAQWLGSLAALLGRSELVARYNRLAPGTAMPPAIASSSAALLAFAAIGGPPESLLVFSGQTERAIGTSLATPEQERAKFTVLLRAALLAVPDSSIRVVTPSSDSTIPARLLRAWHKRDLNQAREILANLQDMRRRGMMRSSDIVPEALYSEAAILASLGDASGAIARLDPTLDSISLAAPQMLANPIHAGSLMRAMQMRAELAAELGDVTSARTWARAVLALWSNPDKLNKARIAAMRRLAN